MKTTSHTTKRAATVALIVAALGLGAATSAWADSAPPAKKPSAGVIDRAATPRAGGHRRTAPKRRNTADSAGSVTIGGQDISYSVFRECVGPLRTSNGVVYRYCIWDAYPMFGPA